MLNLLKILHLILPYIQLLQLLAPRNIAQPRNLIKRKRQHLEGFHFLDQRNIRNVITPEVEISNCGYVIAFCSGFYDGSGEFF